MSPTNDTAERKQRWTELLASHRATLCEVIDLAAAHGGDFILRELGKQAASCLSALNREALNPYFPEPRHGYGSLGSWGENGHAPRIRQMLDSARFRAACLENDVRFAAAIDRAKAAEVVAAAFVAEAA